MDDINHYVDDWLGQTFMVEDSTYRVEYFKWSTNYGSIGNCEYYGHCDYELEYPVWIGNYVTGEGLLKALNIEGTLYQDSGSSRRIMYVVQKIKKVDKDGNVSELAPIEGKFDRETFLQQTVKMETDKTMNIYMIDVEYYDKYIFRRYSGNYNYTYCKNDSKWTEDMKGEMKVKDILEKLNINPYGQMGDPHISYPISIKFM